MIDVSPRDMLDQVSKLVLCLLLVACRRDDPPAGAAPGATTSGAATSGPTTVIDAAVADSAPVDAAAPDAPVDAGALMIDAGVGAGKPKPKRKLGKAGDVCRCFEGRSKGCVAVPCEPGLVCTYACGVPGCHSTCLTAEEAERAKFIP